MLEDFSLEKIVEPLLEWFQENARVLPWREDTAPYRVWVSEIMLQQTRVEAVKPYFERFTKALPNVQALAECEEEGLLKLWEGLGYYNRVRNMQTAAQTVMKEYGGKIPADYEELLKLKGIGHYTAGAIASIAYGIPVPAVDGNVLRVISRVSADDSDIMKQSVRTKVERELEKVIPKTRAGAFNQALMELGATVCLPNGAPLCETCPWQRFCEARAKECWQDLPVKSKAKPRRIEEKTIFVIRDAERVLLRKRPSKGLLAGMYEFPNTRGHLTEEEALSWIKEQNLSPIRIQKLEPAKHIFSHVEWHMTGYVIRVDELSKSQDGLLFVETAESEERYPIPAAFGAYTKYVNLRLGNERF
ncbi:MAG: A/G-specific adenine glycosylase [Lachnospiraceae bacterium]|nr:A/G-specific adenine glycosylase [Lachnospiraceae bacterium]